MHSCAESPLRRAARKFRTPKVTLIRGQNEKGDMSRHGNVADLRISSSKRASFYVHFGIKKSAFDVREEVISLVLPEFRIKKADFEILSQSLLQYLLS